MDRMGHHQIQTTQKYLHALPEADRKNLDALERISRGTKPFLAAGACCRQTGSDVDGEQIIPPMLG